MEPSLTDRFTLGGIELPNRVALAPLAGIGNWFVRLQARRYGAGLVVSEMVSSFAVHYRNERTCRELLRIDPREHEGGAVSIQLFGADPDVMRSAAASVAAAGADLIDINMGCPVPKVCRTGAGAALLADPDRAVAVARAAVEGSGLPVTVKLRSGWRAGETDGVALAHRLVGGRRRRGDRAAPAARDARPPRQARLRARRRAGAHARRAGAAERRAAERRGGPRGLRADRRGRRDAGPRRARQPVAVRGAARAARRRRRAAARCSPSSTG